MAAVALAALLVVAVPVVTAEAQQGAEVGNRPAARPRQAGPLDRLRSRSASQRWKSTRNRLGLGRLPTREPASPAGETIPDERRFGPPRVVRPIPDNASRARIAQQPDTPADRQGNGDTRVPLYFREDVFSPITEILPYYDYEPPAVKEAEKDCLMVCPCPPGGCRKPGGTRECLCPEDYIAEEERWPQPDYEPRMYPEAVFTWDATNLAYRPLYFEDVQLERYGHTYPWMVQPFASVGRFGVQLLGLPYQMTINPIHKRMYSLGYYQPGDWCTPRLHYQVPLDARAGAVEAGVVTGLFFLIP